MAKNEFKVGQQIVYPLQGVGRVIDIEKREFKGKTVPYYKIYIESSDMIVMVPVTNIANLKIRAIVKKNIANEVLENIAAIPFTVINEWKQRQQNNMDLLRSGDINSAAEVVKSLFHRSKIKELPIQERKLFDTSCRIFFDELAIALEQNSHELEESVLEKLEAESFSEFSAFGGFNDHGAESLSEHASALDTDADLADEKDVDIDPEDIVGVDENDIT